MSRTEGLKKWSESLTINVATTVLILLFSFGVSWLSSVLLHLQSKSEIASAISVPVGVVIFAIVSMIGLYVWRRVDKVRPHFPRLHPNYEVISKTIEYLYIDRTSMRYTKKLEIKALNHGMSVFTDKYNWSGQGPVKLSTMIPEHKIIELGTRNIWSIYEVNFGRMLRKGKPAQIHVRWDLEVAKKPSRPFMSQTIEAPTKMLKLVLRVPESFGITTARRIVRPTIDTIDEIEDEMCEVENGYVEWTIKNPRLFYCYELAWDDPGADLTPPQEEDLAVPQQ